MCYAKDISESEVKRIEAEAQKKALESRKFQAQAIQLNLELSKIDKTVIELAKKIQNNEDTLSDLENKLAQLICKVFKNDTLALRLSINGRSSAKVQYNKLNNAKRLLDIYNEVLNDLEKLN